MRISNRLMNRKKWKTSSGENSGILIYMAGSVARLEMPDRGINKQPRMRNIVRKTQHAE